MHALLPTSPHVGTWPAAVSMPRAQGYLTSGPNKFTLAPAHSTLLAVLLYSLHVKNSSLWKLFKD